MEYGETYALGLVYAVYVTEFVRVGLNGLELGLTGARFEHPSILDPQRQEHEDDCGPFWVSRAGKMRKQDTHRIP